LAKKVLAMNRAVANTFFIALARALAGTSGTERGDTLHQLHKSSIEARARWRALDRAAILHNVLMQPGAKKL
jgi:hypothetical protein